MEFSRPLIQAHVSPRTAAMRDVYPEALEAARLRMREGEPISNVHRAATEVLPGAVLGSGTSPGHSIGTTMIEHPAVGANTNTVLRENMILTFHPQVIDQDGRCACTRRIPTVWAREGRRVSGRCPLVLLHWRGKPAITRTEDRSPVVKAQNMDPGARS